MIIDQDIHLSLDVVATIFSTILSIVIYLHSRRRTAAKFFSLFIFTVSIWSIFVTVNVSGSDYVNLFSTIKLSYFMGLLISLLFLIFSYSITDFKDFGNNEFVVPSLLFIIIGYIILRTHLIIDTPIKIDGIINYGWIYGDYWYIFDLYFAYCWIYGLIKINRNYYDGTMRTKIQKKYLLASLIIGVIPASVVGIILPRLGIFDLTWICPLSSVIWTLLISYSIYRHEMFRIRMMLIETLAISFWLFVVIRAIVNWTETYTWLGIASVFIITCAVFIVVRNVQIQLRDREKLDDLKSRIDVRIWNNYLIEKERQRIAREQNHFRIFGFGRFRSLFSFLIRREYL